MAHNGEYFATQGDTSCICVSVSYMVAFSCTTGLYWCVFSTQNCHRSGVYWSFSLYILVCDWCVFILVCDWCVLVFFSVHTGVWLMCTVFSPQYILVCDWCVHFFCTYWCVTDGYCFFPYILVCDWRVLVFSLFCTYWCVTDVYWCLCYSASGHKRRQYQAESRAAPPCAEGRAAEHWWKLAKFKVQVKLTVTLWFGVANVHWAHVLHSCSA